MTDHHVLEQTYTNSFSIIRLMDNRLYSNRCKISLELDLLNSTSTGSLQEGSVALKKIDRWITTVLDQSVFYHVADDVDTGMFSHLENNIIFSPGETYDHMLAMLLHCKLNAIGQNHVRIVQIELSSSMNKNLVHRFSGNAAEKFPSNSEWVGTTSYFSEPWWLRSDGSTMDMIVEPGEDPNRKPDILIDLDVEKQQQLHTAEIIRPNFKVIQ